MKSIPQVAIVLALVSCTPSSPEDCADNVDNDGDLLIDCSDPECATVSACDEDEGDADTDADSDSDSDSDTDADSDADSDADLDEVCDDANGADEDDDGKANCADSDCAGISDNCDEILGAAERATATITGTTNWAGTSTFGWFVWDLSATSLRDPPVRTPCAFTYTTTGTTHASAAACTGCDFAFTVSYSGSSTPTGSNCTDFDIADLSMDGNVYGLGYDADFVYDSQTIPVLMYFVTADSSWQPVTPTKTDVAKSGSSFSYATQLSEYLYYY